MKFGEDLEKVKGMMDPEWNPYWPNYNILKVSYALVVHRLVGVESI